MARFELRDGVTTEEEEKLFFFLTVESGTVTLHVEDPAGEEWDVCWIGPDGRLSLASDIPNGIGLDVDLDGEINSNARSY